MELSLWPGVEAEAGGTLRVPGQSGLPSETLSQKTKMKKPKQQPQKRPRMKGKRGLCLTLPSRRIRAAFEKVWFVYL